MILITSWYRDKLIQSHTSSCCSSHTSCFYTYFKWILYEQEYSTEWDGEEGMVVKHEQSVTIHGSVLDLNRTDCAVLIGTWQMRSQVDSMDMKTCQRCRAYINVYSFVLDSLSQLNSSVCKQSVLCILCGHPSQPGVLCWLGCVTPSYLAISS